MKEGSLDLQKAVQAASQTVAEKAEAFEVFCRRAESFQLTAGRSGSLLWRETAELGVACRVQRGPLLGFGRASGSGSAAGREAARLALAFLAPGHEPLPPSYQLGAVPVPPRPRPRKEAVEKLFEELARDSEKRELTVTTVTAETLFFRGEGFSARFQNQLLLVTWQQELLPGVAVAFRRAGCQLQDIAAPSALGILEGAPSLTGLRFEHGLRRVLLAPDVAAPLLVLLARHLAPGKTQLSQAWDLWDLRYGEQAFLPMACDGEGFPARNLPILVPQREAGPSGNQETPAAGASRGAVRVPWDAPPAPNPVHLWQRSEAPSSRLETLDFEGLLALAPVSEVVLEGGGRFRLLTLAVEARGGKPLAQGVVVLSGSLSRLPHALVATLGQQEHVALGCVVSTPWLLFKNLEVS